MTRKDGNAKIIVRRDQKERFRGIAAQKKMTHTKLMDELMDLAWGGIPSSPPPESSLDDVIVATIIPDDNESAVAAIIEE